LPPKAWGSTTSWPSKRAISPPRGSTSSSTEDGFRGTRASWKHLDYFQRPQDKPYTESNEDVIQGACVWARSATPAPAWARWSPTPMATRLGDFRAAGFEDRKPEDLKDVPVAVGLRAGSHFNVPYRLEKIPAARAHQDVNTGGFGARLKALLDGEVEAASLLPPQIAMAEQLGLRQGHRGPVHTLWWVPDRAAPEVVRGYLNALDRAEKAMDANIETYLPLWKLAVPAEFESFHPGTSASSAAASVSYTRGSRKRNSTTPWRRSSAGASISISRSASSRTWWPRRKQQC